jgi:hypothetical protein
MSNHFSTLEYRTVRALQRVTCLVSRVVFRYTILRGWCESLSIIPSASSNVGAEMICVQYFLSKQEFDHLFYMRFRITSVIVNHGL